MKKKIIFSLIAIGFMVLNISNVSAIGNTSQSYYINENGVLMTKYDYELLKESFSENEIKYFSKDFYDMVKGHKWVFSEYEEIDLNSTNESPWPAGSTHETDYKKIYICFASSTSADYNVMNLKLVWKKMPKTRSYDVVAMLGNNLTFYDNTGNLIFNYTDNGQTYTNSLDSSNTNIYTNTNTGFSFVTKLPTSTNITSMDIEMYGVAKITNIRNATVYGTYQHAQSNVTLTQAKNHYFNRDGLGGVLKWSDNEVQNKYDNMKGVYYTVAS